MKKMLEGDVVINGFIFTKRDIEIIDLTFQEFTDEEIGKKLLVGFKAVQAAKTKIISMTGSKRMMGVIRWALQNNLIKL